jgi:hypothetical protein
MTENIKPRFEVHKMEGKGIRRVATPKVDPKRKDKDGHALLLGGFTYEDKEVNAGWMVYFPSGASIHVWTQEEMERQGFMADPHLVNMETGDEVAPMVNTSLKARSEQMSTRSRTSKVAQI